MSSGLRVIEGINILPLDGLWQSLADVPAEDKLIKALEYSGCDFHDEEHRFVANHVISLSGIGGVPAANTAETDTDISKRLRITLSGTRELMGSSAAFSYLNSGEKDPIDLYDAVTKLGHLSIAHTVQTNFVIAGISEAAELELGLQRDLIHLSKVTNARTRVQNHPPIVVREEAHTQKISLLYDQINSVAEDLRTDANADTLEYVNGLFPVNKATILMLSGDLSNMRKVSSLRDDLGKERELREIADGLYTQLSLLWPEIMKDKEK